MMVLAAYLLPSNKVIIMAYMDPPWTHIDLPNFEKGSEWSEKLENRFFENDPPAQPTRPTLTQPNNQ